MDAHAFIPSLAPSEGERVAEDRARGFFPMTMVCSVIPRRFEKRFLRNACSRMQLQNVPLTPSLSPSEGEREGVRGSSTFSLNSNLIPLQFLP
jgi:hypothetical protein